MTPRLRDNLPQKETNRPSVLQSRCCVTVTCTVSDLGEVRVGAGARASLRARGHHATFEWGRRKTASGPAQHWMPRMALARMRKRPSARWCGRCWSAPAVPGDARNSSTGLRDAYEHALCLPLSKPERLERSSGWQLATWSSGDTHTLVSRSPWAQVVAHGSEGYTRVGTK